jgi:hypothetical protein
MQLKWEAAVVQYVNFVWEKTQLSCSTEPDAMTPQLSDSIPLLGPCFMPPAYLHASKRPGAMHTDPGPMYLRPLNIIHPFYYPNLISKMTYFALVALAAFESGQSNQSSKSCHRSLGTVHSLESWSSSSQRG